MHKKLNYLLLFILISHIAGAQKQDISLEDIWTRRTFSAQGVPGFQSLKNGKYYCALDDNKNLLRHEFATGKAIDTIFRNDELKLNPGDTPIEASSFEFSDDETRVLLATKPEAIYRHSTRALYYVFDLKKRKLSLPIREKVRYAEFSPDAGKIAYVKDNDLYYYDLFLQKEQRVTNDGKVNNIINGATDWVYEEEFGIYKAFFWNASSDKIAFYRFDESRVKEYEMNTYGALYPGVTRFKYPKAGEDNSRINIFIYDMKSQLIAEADIGKETD